MAWIGPADIRDRWIGAELPDDPIIDAIIGDAEIIVRFEFADIDERIGDAPDVDETLLGNVVFVVAQMVMRVLRNPEGIRSRTEQTGPFSTTRTVSGDDPGSPHMTDTERAMLSGLGGAPRPRAFTIDPTPVGAAQHPLHGAAVNGPFGWAPGET